MAGICRALLVGREAPVGFSGALGDTELSYGETKALLPGVCPVVEAPDVWIHSDLRRTARSRHQPKPGGAFV